MRVIKLVYLVSYYCFARFLPTSYTPIVGKVSKWIRYQLCRNIFAKCGKNVNVERGAFFGSGSLIEIGDNSGIGVNCHLPSNTKIGNNVMMAPNCYIFNMNHAFDRTDIPMCQQGSTPPLTTIIEDDVWIGRGVMMTPGRVVKRGSVVAAGCVLCKDFPEYSIVGGNPSRFIKSRL